MKLKSLILVLLILSNFALAKFSGLAKADSVAVTALDGITSEMIFEKSLSALGGKEVLLKVNDRTVLMSATFQDFNIEIEVYQKAPNKYMQTTSFAGQETFVVYDGTKGSQKSFMGSGDIEGNELEMLKIEASIHFLANWVEAGIKLELAGLEKINGKDSYKVKMILPSGTSIMQYYDVESYLKVREVKSISTPQGTVEVSIDYDDYRDVEGFKYPFKLKQSAGPMKLDFDVTGVMVNKGISDEFFIKKSE